MHWTKSAWPKSSRRNSTSPMLLRYRWSRFAAGRAVLSTTRRRSSATSAAERCEVSIMACAISRVAIVVRDYDEAIAYYTQSLRFELLEDTPMGKGKRWVVVAPRGASGSALVLARAANPEQESRIGNQTGGRVFLFLHTDDFDRDYSQMKARGVRFTEEPRRESFGTAVVFEDLYGNRWDLVQLNTNARN